MNTQFNIKYYVLDEEMSVITEGNITAIPVRILVDYADAFYCNKYH